MTVFNLGLDLEVLIPVARGICPGSSTVEGSGSKYLQVDRYDIS